MGVKQIMEAFNVLGVVTVSVICLRLVSSECRLDAASSSSPYLVRIIQCSEPNPDWPFNNLSQCLVNTTLAHGSLFSADKVITTCTWMSNQYSPEVLRFQIYNTKNKCSQERSHLKVEQHPDCDQSIREEQNSQHFMVNDIALWIMESPFDVNMNAIMWGTQWGGISPPLSEMIRLLVKLNSKSATCKAVQFSNASAVDGDVESNSNVVLFPWKDCLADLERIFPIDDDPDDKPLRRVRSHTFACFKDKGISSFRFAPPQEIGYDWRSGTAVICEAEGKKVPVGMLSRIIAPAPWAKTSSFRVAVLFHGQIYSFLSDTIGVHRMPQKQNHCQLSGEYHYPFLLRITKKVGGFNPVVTVGHGAVIKRNMVLSSCTSYRKLPQDLSSDQKWEFIGYNTKDRCSQIRKPVRLFLHPDCSKYDEDQAIANDFAIWIPDRDFAMNTTVLVPNLWQGPIRPPLDEVVRSILELSDDEYVGVISRRLSAGIFTEPTLVTAERQLNAEVLFVPWEECKESVLFDTLSQTFLVPNVGDIKKEYVVDQQNFPVFCGIESFRSVGSPKNESVVDWYSGAIVMYSFLYVFEWGQEPATVTYPIGILSRVLVGQAKPDGKNIRIISGFTKGFDDFFESIQNTALPRYYMSQFPRSAANLSRDAPALLVSAFCILVATWNRKKNLHCIRD